MAFDCGTVARLATTTNKTIKSTINCHLYATGKKKFHHDMEAAHNTCSSTCRDTLWETMLTVIYWKVAVGNATGVYLRLFPFIVSAG